MARAFAKAFYNSRAWRKVSALYMQSQHYVCERCGGAASICHHKRWLNPQNINDLDVALSEENLECLCLECHNREHMTKPGAAVVDSAGNVVGMRESDEMREWREAVAWIDDQEEAGQEV